MKRLYILAPNDRFNYGDLLFPYVIREFFKDVVDRMEFCSTTRSDLSALGGLKTKKHSVLYRLKASDENVLMVAGGESMLVGWDCIYGYVSPLVNYVNVQAEKPESVWMRLLGKERLEKLSRWLVRVLSRAHTVFPYTIGRHELPNLNKVLYNSVGGSNIRNIPHAMDPESLSLLRDSDYLAVRDTVTLRMMQEVGCEAYLVADCAILISDIFDEKYLADKTSLPESLFQGRPYIFYQINLELAQWFYPVIIDALRQIRRETGCAVCLCPIGTAFGHEDQVALAYIHGQLADEDVKFISRPTVWDIMSLIKHARLYLGTSLHGVITAMSYGVPFVGVEVTKVKAYIESWVCEEPEKHFCKMDDMPEAVRRAWNLVYDCAEQKKSVRESFERMRKIIQDGK